jgi:serine/threonine protein phosphatase 1
LTGTGIHFLDAKGPEGIRIYAIGDIHGCLGLLETMYGAIEEDIRQHPESDWRIIHLGDYVDRGPNAKGVIDFLIGACAGDNRIIALAGNHDVGFLDFLAVPSAEGLFAHNGGGRTALSYGVQLDFSTPATLRSDHMALKEAVPAEHLAFLHGLERKTEFGDFFFCHAGIRPGVPLERQSPDDLVWIRYEFLNHSGLHPKVIVHGHTPSPEPEILPNRINVDTGAFASGVLTALIIDVGEKLVLQVSG